MTPKLKKIIIILILAIVLFVVYAVFIKKDPTSQSLVTTGSTASADAQALGTQISQALLKIEQIKLDRAIFTSDIYKTLVDRSEPITDEPIRRSNPFAPIGEISVSSSVRNVQVSSSTPPATVQATTTPKVAPSVTPATSSSN